MNKRTTLLLLAVTILGLVTGCKNTSRFLSPGRVDLIRPASTNETVSTVTNQTVDGVQIVVQTNYVVTPAVFYTNQVLSAEAQMAVDLARVGAQVSGVPWGDAAATGATGLAAIVLGWMNWRNRRKLSEERDFSSTMQSVAQELRDNINTVLVSIPETNRGEVKRKLQDSQIAAGPEVSSAIKELVRPN
jgi:hypothetical protein